MSDQEETLFEFPCSFPIKVFGVNHDDFEIAVIEIIRGHCQGMSEHAVSTKESKGGKYLSMTVTIDAQSKEQLDNIYRELSSHSLVKMAL